MSHELINPEGLPPAVGFSYAVIPERGRTVYLAGQTGHLANGTIADGLVDQFAQACRNVATALDAAAGLPEHVVQMMIYTTNIEVYRDLLVPIGIEYREVFGSHYPAMALVGVRELFDPLALVELVCTAVIPD